MKRFKPSRSTAIALAVIAVLLVIIGILGWLYIQTSRSSESQAKKDSNRVIAHVGELYALPTNEEPTVAQIQDKSKLDNQAFFKDAQNGDYLLVYKESKIALVYREKIHKLITVGPVNLEDQQTPANNASGDVSGAATDASTPNQTNPANP